MNGILIEPIINGKKHGFAIQGKVFSFDLHITNGSEKPSPEFNITKIYFKSAEGYDASDDFSGKSFFVDKLNPGESRILKIGKNGQFLCGLVAVEANINPKDAGTKIKFLQKNPCTKEISEIHGDNRWYDFSYIKSLSEYTQEISSRWMMILTVVIAAATLIQSVLFFLKR